MAPPRRRAELGAEGGLEASAEVLVEVAVDDGVGAAASARVQVLFGLKVVRDVPLVISFKTAQSMAAWLQLSALRSTSVKSLDGQLAPPSQSWSFGMTSVRVWPGSFLQV